jgi:hypothetical protein
MVRGELAIGLFALKDIAAQEELTFDYNFERYGDKPMRCFCGTKKCRKFIGGTQVGAGSEQRGASMGFDAHWVVTCMLSSTPSSCQCSHISPPVGMGTVCTA